MKSDPAFKRVSVGTIWLWFALFALIPNPMVLGASLLRRGEVRFIDFTFTLENYRRLLDPLYLEVLWNSFYLAAFSTLSCLLLG
jgi:spermidine/putrescine transport system permease protein